MSESKNNSDTRHEVTQAIKAFRAGRPVIIHDDESRENENDLVFPALSVTTGDVTQMRNDAGGLICVALSHDVAEAFELPYLSDTLSHPCVESGTLDYGDRSSFTLPVNHRSTVTGIPDKERATTISALGHAATNPSDVDFDAEFRAPGHVQVLKAAPGLLSERKGHTELGIKLAESAGCAPAVVVCEMLDDETGKALSNDKAALYSQNKGIPHVCGEAIANYI